MENDFAEEEDDRDTLQTAKLNNVHRWVHTQSLNVPPSSQNSVSDVSKASDAQTSFSKTETAENESSASRSDSVSTSSKSFDFDDFSDEAKPDASSDASFVSINDRQQQSTATSVVSADFSSMTTTLQNINRLLSDLGLGAIYLPVSASSMDLLDVVGKKFASVLENTRQSHERTKAIIKTANEWKSREQDLLKKIRSLELQLEEKEKAEGSVQRAHFKTKETAENMIKSLQDSKKRLEIENNKLSNMCTSLQRKQNDLNRVLESTKAEKQTQDETKEKLKERIRLMTEQEKQNERRNEELQKQQKIHENALRLRDSELCKLKALHTDIVDENSHLSEKQSQMEKALRDQEKECLLLKKKLESDDHSLQSKRALVSATEETKRLKEDLSMERSKTIALERKCDKFMSDLKQAQQSCKQHEQQLKDKNDQMFDMEIELKRRRLEEAATRPAESLKQRSQKIPELRRQVDHLEAENKDLNCRLNELSHKYKFIQKENLRLDERRIRAENRAAEYQSEITRLADDLAEKEQLMKEVNTRLNESEKSLAATESRSLIQCDHVKESQIEKQSLQKSNVNLVAVKCSLEHRVLNLEATCEQLREKLREKITKEENRIEQDKLAYERLRTDAQTNQHQGSHLKRGDVFLFCEKRIDELTSEVDSLKQENHRCSSQLKQVENELLEHERSSATMALPTDKIKNRLRLAEKSITDLSAKLIMSKESKVAEIEQMHAEKQSLETRISEQKQIIRKLQEGLHQPHPELQAAQKQIKALRAKIKSQSARDVMLLTGQQNTRDRIPRPQIEKILKSLCVMMDVHNPSLLIDRTLKLMKVVASLPRVEKFVSEVCDVVLCKGALFIPHHLKPSSTRDSDVAVLVPSILKYWLEHFSY